MPLAFRKWADGVGAVEIPDGGGFTNIFILGPLNDAIIVDSYTNRRSGELTGSLEAIGVAPKHVRAILVTHGHEDHYGGAGALAKWCGAPVWAHLAAATQIEDAWGYFSASTAWVPNTTAADWDNFRASAGEACTVARILRAGDVIEHCGLAFNILHIPGHERGAIALHDPKRKIIFTGDLVQGGMDASKNWLGLYTDPASHRRSLERVMALKPEWNFKGHRVPRHGTDVQTDLDCALARTDAIENALLEALKERSPLTLAEAVRAVFARLLGMTVSAPPDYARVSVEAFLLDLSRRSQVRRTAELAWEAA